MTQKAVQDYYTDEAAVCYGCGPDNPHGLRIKTYWDGKEGVCRFKPRPYHTAFPGYVHGGLIASLIDCNCTGTAAAAAYEAEGRDLGTDPVIRFVTRNLAVCYHRPTPIHKELVVRARVKELHERKVVLSCSLYADDDKCATGEVTAVRAPKAMLRQGNQ